MGFTTAILIVDASKYMRDYLQQSLKKKGYQNIIAAVDGKNALDALMEHRVDLIITELDMPKVNGLELLRALSNHSTLKHIPVVVLASDLSDETFKQAMAVHANDYIKKPFTPAEIDCKIKSVISKS